MIVRNVKTEIKAVKNYWCSNHTPSRIEIDMEKFIEKIIEEIVERVSSETTRRVSEKLREDLATPPPERMLTRDEVCDYLHVTKPTLHNWAKSGKLVPQKVNGRVLYPEGMVNSLVGTKQQPYTRVYKGGVQHGH